MRETPNVLFYRVALAACTLSAAACGPSDEIASLGLYSKAALVEAGSPANPPDAGSAQTTAPGDGGGSSLEPATEAGASQDPGAAAGRGLACAATGCVGAKPAVTTDPATHCHQLVGLDGFGGRASPPLPPDSSPDHYVGFTLPAPVSGTEYLRSIAPVIESVKYLHHMKLYESDRSHDAPGFPASRRLLYSWAPGESGLFLDPSVGVAVTEGAHYELELHYAGSPPFVVDGSGFEVCYTTEAPEYLVSLSTLSAEGPPAGPATGTCSPHSTQPIVVLAAQPQTTVNARHVKLTVERQTGQEMLLDVPYDHELPRRQVLNVQLDPGDTLRTHCDFTPPIAGAPGARCDVQVLHWPAGTLVSGPQGAFPSCSE